MEKRPLGKTGMHVPVLGFGGAEIGYQNVDVESVKHLLNTALDEGLTVIDTAECYKSSEEMIGQTVASRRSEFFLFTKTGHDPSDGDHWNPKMMAAGIDRSLRLLQTSYLDLLHLHSCGEEQLRSGEVVEVVQRARESGKTRFIGYSGDGGAALYAVKSGLFDTLQTSVSIADQEAIDLTLPLAQAQGMGIIAKRPIANAAWRTGARPADPYHHAYWDRLTQLRYDFLNTESAVSTALRFTLAAPGVDLAIVGTRTPDRWRQNSAMLAAGALDPATYARIRAAWKETAQPDWIGQT